MRQNKQYRDVQGEQIDPKGNLELCIRSQQSEDPKKTFRTIQHNRMTWDNRKIKGR